MRADRIVLTALTFILLSALSTVYADDPEQEGCTYVYALDDPSLEMPCEMADRVTSVWLDCEVRAAAQTPYAVLGDVVSPTGDYGQAAINQIHAAGMSAMDLDFTQEHDRVQFGIALWGWHGWAPWACS